MNLETIAQLQYVCSSGLNGKKLIDKRKKAKKAELYVLYIKRSLKIRKVVNVCNF